ncbi:hypothetical protein DT065_16055 [Salicibibacter kimchii]|uniref:ZinT domain-containing protein n=2 Tax=Salicibibacter kimchii TaxID=2099786 RepID=A0A345C2C6_9BACI|nr:hypothetical protein DT065_16055 [Salicibibacter kimchii]
MVKWSSVMVIGSLLAACQASDEDQDVGGGSNHDAPEKVEIEGLADHYHTGDTINLTAELDEETDYDHWRWYTRDDEGDEWANVSDQGDREFTEEATVDGQEIKVVLFDDDHDAYVQSDSVEVVIDDHDHDEESQRIYDGYFEDSEVEDRDLSDWEGDWQSVYPYLQEGDLDEVFEHKVEDEGDMTEEEYKEYYDEGYQTEVDRIVIEEATVTFFDNAEEYTGEYTYDGYEILTYDAGNRGVRYIFELEDGEEEAPQYIQFSDHNIFPTESHHFHLFWGDDREELLEEVTNWPTYYPSEMDTDEIVQEMMAH